MLADKWQLYCELQQVVEEKREREREDEAGAPPPPETLKSDDGKLLDLLDMHRMCCRLQFITNLEALEKL